MWAYYSLTEDMDISQYNRWDYLSHGLNMCIISPIKHLQHLTEDVNYQIALTWSYFQLQSNHIRGMQKSFKHSRWGGVGGQIQGDQEILVHQLTLSNPIFLLPAYSPALIYFGRERGWWITCNYPTILKEKNINRKSTTCAICWLKSVLQSYHSVCT
jgi:hypothetical protein